MNRRIDENIRKHDSEKSRSSILAAATRMFAEKGLYGARIDEIASASGLNKNMIYVYFGSKEELYMAVLAELYGKMERLEEEILKKDLSGRVLIEEIIDSYFCFLDGNPDFVHVLINENLMKGQYLAQLPRESVRRSSFRQLANCIERDIKAGLFIRNADARQVLLTMNAICFSNFSNKYTLPQLMGDSPADDFPAFAEQRKRQAKDVIMAYLMSDNNKNEKEVSHDERKENSEGDIQE